MRISLWLVLSSVIVACAHPSPPTAKTSLGGTSWRLVKFQGGDGAVFTPDDGSKYTLAFDADGIVSARIDCNRARGGGQRAGHHLHAIGPFAAPRAGLPVDPLHV